MELDEYQMSLVFDYGYMYDDMQELADKLSEDTKREH